jgi:hypothetical protein
VKEDEGKYTEMVGGRTWTSKDGGWVEVDSSEVCYMPPIEEAILAQQEEQEEQEEQPKKQYECTICQDAVGGFDHRKCQGTIPYDCDECFDYYRDHRECQGMTRSEIVYEDYCRNYPSGREY